MRLFYSHLLLIFGLSLLSVGSIAQDSNSTSSAPFTLEVIDPYIEVRSGPGRGYPIFHVIEQGETVEVLTRRPDWYEIRSGNGKTGWAAAAQLSRTLQPTGEPVDLPTVSYGDYLKNSWRVGFSVGPFSSGELKSSDVFTVNVGYRPLEWLALDLEAGNIYGSDIRGDFYNVGLFFEPYSRWRYSPVLILGSGKLGIDTQPKLTPLNIDDSDFTLYGVGLNYYMGRNFLVKLEFRSYTVSTDASDERLETWKIGFNTFF